MFGVTGQKVECGSFYCKVILLVLTASEFAKVQAWKRAIWLHRHGVILLVWIQGIQNPRKQQPAGVHAVAFLYGMKVRTQTKIFFLVCITTIRDLLVRNSYIQGPIILSDKQEEEHQKPCTSMCFLQNFLCPLFPLPWQQ